MIDSQLNAPTAVGNQSSSAMREPFFTETLQISIVVPDLDRAVRTYADEYGIGPWEIYP